MADIGPSGLSWPPTAQVPVASIGREVERSLPHEPWGWITPRRPHILGEPREGPEAADKPSTLKADWLEHVGTTQCGCLRSSPTVEESPQKGQGAHVHHPQHKSPLRRAGLLVNKGPPQSHILGGFEVGRGTWRQPSASGKLCADP